MNRTIRRLQQLTVLDGQEKLHAKAVSITSSMRKCCGLSVPDDLSGLKA